MQTSAPPQCHEDWLWWSGSLRRTPLRLIVPSFTRVGMWSHGTRQSHKQPKGCCRYHSFFFFIPFWHNIVCHFPRGVPHVRYQRLVTIRPGLNKPDLAQTPWEAGKPVVKHLHTDQRGRFGTWSQDTDKGTNEASMPVLEDNKTWMGVPIWDPRELHPAICGTVWGVPQGGTSAGSGRKRKNGKPSQACEQG